MELPIAFQSLDRRDALALLHRRQRHARHDAASVYMHGASPTLAAITALLWAGQSQFFAQRIKQRRARFDRDGASLAVDNKAHRQARRTSIRGLRRLAGGGDSGGAHVTTPATEARSPSSPSRKKNQREHAGKRHGHARALNRRGL